MRADSSHQLLATTNRLTTTCAAVASSFPLSCSLGLFYTSGHLASFLYILVELKEKQVVWQRMFFIHHYWR